MNQTKQITVASTQVGYLVSIHGQGTVRESPIFKEFALRLFEVDVQVVVDLNRCDYLDSTFLGCLLILQKRSQEQDAGFAIFAAQEKRQQLLHPCRLDLVLNFTEEFPQAEGDSVHLPLEGADPSNLGPHLLETHRQLAELNGPAAATFQQIVTRLEQELNGTAEKRA